MIDEAEMKPVFDQHHVDLVLHDLRTDYNELKDMAQNPETLRYLLLNLKYLKETYELIGEQIIKLEEQAA